MPLTLTSGTAAARGFGFGGQAYKPGSASYTSPGTFSFTVPGAVRTLNITTLVGAGGGGGGNSSGGNLINGTGGGSGGYYQNQTISVNPGETLTFTIGAGGYGGNYQFNSTSISFNSEYPTWPNQNPGTINGGPGDTTKILRGATVLLQATGGGGGYGNQGNGNSGGSAGSPNGVAGSGTYDTGNCTQLQNQGINALSLGSGGIGGQCRVGSPGQNGQITLTW